MPFCSHGIDARKKERIVEKIGQQGRSRKGLNPLVGHAHNNRASKASKVLSQRMGSYGMPDCICT